MTGPEHPPERQHSNPEIRSTMLAAQLVPPRLSTASPMTGHYRPLGYDPARDDRDVPRNRKLPSLGASSERLPPVSQLLTPSLQSNLSPRPPYEGPHESQVRTERRYDVASPDRNPAAEGRTRPGSGYFQERWRESGHHSPPFHLGQTAARSPYSAFGTRPPSPPYQTASSPPVHTASHGLGGASNAYSAWQSRDFTRIPAPAASPTGPESPAAEQTASVKRLVEGRGLPGERALFVYDDGINIPTVGDGEAVNGQWGMTKAGKPRKRMPQACVPCRAKKIKCDPGDGACSQCAKSGKECHYTEGPRAHRSHPSSPSTVSTPPAETKVSSRRTPTTKSATSSAMHSHRPSMTDTRSHSKRMASPEPSSRTSPPSKRRRTDSQLIGPRPFFGLSTAQVDGDRSPVSARWPSSTPNQELENPFGEDSKLVTHFLELFFEHTNGGMYCLLPRDHFFRWLQSERPKSKLEILVLHGIIALGSTYSHNPCASDYGRDIVQKGLSYLSSAPKRSGMMFLMARMMFGQYYFNQTEYAQMIELDDTVRALSLMKFDLERRLGNPDEDGFFDFGLNQFGLAELSRRLEWWSFILDRIFVHTCLNEMALHKEDVFRRLPCNQDDYERQVETSTPYFDNGIIGRRYVEIKPGERSLSLYAHMLTAMSWPGQITRESKRALWQDESVYPGNYTQWKRHITQQMERWMRSLPPDIVNSQANIKKHTADKNISIYICIHGFYHSAHISLNRRVRSGLLPVNVLVSNIQDAVHHAKSFLNLVDEVWRQGDVNTALSTQGMIAYMIAASVDILLATGSTRDTSTIELCDGKLNLLAEMSELTALPRTVLAKAKASLQQIAAVVERARREDRELVWAFSKPLHPLIEGDLDLFYSDMENATVALREALKLPRIDDADARTVYID